jgi:chromosomal replication initiator protein
MLPGTAFDPNGLNFGDATRPMDTTAPPPAPRTSSQPWDGFLAGEENALALASVTALARGESEGISPLVLHGPSGSGKSRLLAGLVAERMIRRPESAVAEVDGEAFAAACGEAASRPEAWAEVRARFRNLDLLALDGLESVARVPPALEELSHTLDALEARGAAVAIAARTPPGQWSGWPIRLINRLLGGLAVRVDPPGLALRRRYLLDRGRTRGLALASDAVDALAEAADGFRTIDGWLSRLALAARVERRPLDRALVTAFLDDEAEPVPAMPTIEAVARAVASRFGVRLSDLRGTARQPKFVEPRHLAMHLARADTDLSLAAIGTYFGGRDPATVRHACRSMDTRLGSDPALASAAEAIAAAWRRRPV